MPYYVSTKILLALTGDHPAAAPRILVLGVTFKRDITDYRHSPALKLMEILRRRGAVVIYHDPYVPTLTLDGESLRSEPLTAQALADVDCVAIATDHTILDYSWIVRHARFVFDTRNATARVSEGREKILRI
jgi:UDP-N-acetyl-D-glucosamine dehydrogenase